MKVTNVLFLFVFVIGCSSSNKHVVYQTEFKEVLVPVRYKIERPNRPVYTKKDTVPTYLLKLKHYAINLELLIDEHNKGAAEDGQK